MTARFLVILALLGCRRAPLDTAGAARPAPEPLMTEGDALERVHALLSVRDAQPDCATIEGMAGDDAVLTLLRVVDEITTPPWVPLRAASCVIDGHPSEAHDALLDWVRDPSVPGRLALLLGRLDTLPLEVAMDVVDAGMDGLNHDEVVAAALASGRAELVAITERGPPTDTIVTAIRVPDSDVAAMQRALSVHDPEPDCAEVEALSERPVEALVTLVEEMPLPPVAPMRAARCVVTRHADAAPGALVAWVNRDAPALRELVLQHLDTLPLAVAVSVVEAGLASPHAEQVAAAVQAAGRPDLAQLAATP